MLWRRRPCLDDVLLSTIVCYSRIPPSPEQKEIVVVVGTQKDWRFTRNNVMWTDWYGDKKIQRSVGWFSPNALLRVRCVVNRRLSQQSKRVLSLSSRYVSLGTARKWNEHLRVQSVRSRVHAWISVVRVRDSIAIQRTRYATRVRRSQFIVSEIIA
jgi:hypothetical protein